MYPSELSDACRCRLSPAYLAVCLPVLLKAVCRLPGSLNLAMLAAEVFGFIRLGMAIASRTS